MDPFIAVSMHPCILHCALKRDRERLRLKLKPLIYYKINGGREGVILSNHHNSVGGLFPVLAC